VILDLGLPDVDGVEVVTGIRGWSTTPIVILSVRETEHDKVAALDAGADDYVTKPFGMAELLARLRAAIRRARPAPPPAGPARHWTIAASCCLRGPQRRAADGPHGRLRDRSAAKQATPDGDEIRLTPTEWGIVEALVRNEGPLVTQQQLLKTVW
jgi:two-component system, OmpR family, KDP operon response regulator KdpE